MESIEIVVYGRAAPGGSKSAFVHPQTKQVIVKDANPRAAPWRQQVAQAAGEQYDGPLLDGPVSVEVAFYRSRNKGDFGTGRNAGALKGSAPLYPTQAPDATKLWRSTEDALTGVVWRDDAQVVVQLVRKLYGEPERAEITVTPMAAATIEEQRQEALEGFSRN